MLYKNKDTSKTKFIVFEGKDGSGKSTLVRLLVDRLIKEGNKVLTFSEPKGVTSRSEYYYQRLLNGEGDALENIYMSRKESQSAIAKAYYLNYDYIIVDRYILSTMAYQGADKSDIVNIYNENKMFIEPDLYIYVKVDYNSAVSRLDSRDVGNSLDFKSEDEFDSIYYNESINIMNLIGESKTAVFENIDYYSEDVLSDRIYDFFREKTL